MTSREKERKNTKVYRTEGRGSVLRRLYRGRSGNFGLLSFRPQHHNKRRRDGGGPGWDGDGESFFFVPPTKNRAGFRCSNKLSGLGVVSAAHFFLFFCLLLQMGGGWFYLYPGCAGLELVQTNSGILLLCCNNLFMFTIDLICVVLSIPKSHVPSCASSTSFFTV